MSTALRSCVVRRLQGLAGLELHTEYLVPELSDDNLQLTTGYSMNIHPMKTFTQHSMSNFIGSHNKDSDV